MGIEQDIEVYSGMNSSLLYINGSNDVLSSVIPHFSQPSAPYLLVLGRFRSRRHGTVALAIKYELVRAMTYAVQGGLADHLVRREGRTRFTRVR